MGVAMREYWKENLGVDGLPNRRHTVAVLPDQPSRTRSRPLTRRSLGRAVGSRRSLQICTTRRWKRNTWTGDHPVPLSGWCTVVGFESTSNLDINTLPWMYPALAEHQENDSQIARACGTAQSRSRPGSELLFMKPWVYCDRHCDLPDRQSSRAWCPHGSRDVRATVRPLHRTSGRRSKPRATIEVNDDKTVWTVRRCPRCARTRRLPGDQGPERRMAPRRPTADIKIYQILGFAPTSGPAKPDKNIARTPSSRMGRRSTAADFKPVPRERHTRLG